VPDMFAPPVFDGVHPDPETWLAHFRRYVDCRLMPEDDQLAFFPLFLKSAAIDWYDGLSAIQKRYTELLLKEFEQYFCPSPMDQVLNTESVFNRNQKSGEKVRDYVAAMQKLARRIPAVDEDLLKCMVLPYSGQQISDTGASSSQVPDKHVRRRTRYTATRDISRDASDNESTTNRGSCERCGRGHCGLCPATNMNCYNCGGRDHFSARCRMGRRGGRRASP